MSGGLARVWTRGVEDVDACRAECITHRLRSALHCVGDGGQIGFSYIEKVGGVVLRRDQHMSLGAAISLQRKERDRSGILVYNPSLAPCRY